MCAVPGPVTSAASTGCHVCFQAGAELVTALKRSAIIGRSGNSPTHCHAPPILLDALTDTERLVYDALPARTARDPDEVAVAAGLPAAGVLGPQPMLEIAGLVQRHEGKWRLCRRSA